MEVFLKRTLEDRRGWLNLFPYIYDLLKQIQHAQSMTFLYNLQEAPSHFLNILFAGLCDQFNLCVKPGLSGVGFCGTLYMLGPFLYC